MDEHSFDDYIKQKIGNYEDPSFDEGTFNEFQKRLSSVQRLSWYKLYRTEIIVVSAFILFTLLNSYVMWSVFSQNENIQDTSLIKSYYVNTAYLNQIDSLNAVIDGLRKENELLACNAENEIQNVSSKEDINEPLKINSLINKTPDDRILISTEDALPASLLNLLEENELLAHKDGNVYLLKKEVKTQEVSEPSFAQNTRYTNNANKPFIIYLPSETIIQKTEEQKEDIHDKNISAKVRNDLEKHYHNGLGINIAPHADLVMNAFSGSETAISPRVGLTFDWVISPHISIETSLDYTTNRFITNSNFDKWNLEQHTTGPWGDLKKISIATRNISVPLGIKYRTWISPLNQMTLRTTYTPYYSLAQTTLCTYTGLNNYGDGDDSVSKLEKSEIRKYFGSSIKLSLGLQHQLKQKNKIETSLFYEKSIGTVGLQHTRMQLYGINVAYWFKLK